MPQLASDHLWHLSITQTSLVLTLKIAVIAAATLTLFFQDLALVFSDALQNETTNYILAIPFIFAYLVYRKRKMLRAVMSRSGEESLRHVHLASVAGILLTAVAVLLYWYGSYTFTPLEFHMFTLPLFVAGLCLVFFNPQTLRQMAFPVAFLFFLMPPPAEILYTVGSTLQVLSAEASNAIISIFHIASTLTYENGSPLIQIISASGSRIPFSVDIACSGIYSLIGFTVFAATVGFTIRDKLWKKVALVIVGIPLVYLLNILRITTMLFMGYYYGADLALQIFHLLGGWILIFLGTLLLLVISEKVFKTQIFSKPVQGCGKCNPEPQPNRDYCQGCGRIVRPPIANLRKSDLFKIAALILVVALLASIQAPVFVLAKGPPIVVVNTASGRQFSSEFLPQTDQYTPSFLFEDTNFEAQAKQDLSLVYFYTPVNESREPVWATIEIASTQESLHRWEVCMITWPLAQGKSPRATQIDLRDIQLMQNPPIISRYFAFNYTDTNETQAVLYWYETTYFIVNSTTMQKHVKISLIAYPQTMDELADLKNQLVVLATAITNYWQPIETWSQATMVISQNGLALSSGATIALAATLVYYVAEARRTKKTNLIAARKLADSSREIVLAVQKTRPATLENLAATIKTSTKEKISKEQLEQRLRELEKTGIIRSSVQSFNDVPMQTWRT